ncbi:MAG TPA: alanine--tRNA ligase, partial [Thermopetrobacter sp.]|nr:alanine--tRNA ligase [Thermopetrobacter sp.]
SSAEEPVEEIGGVKVMLKVVEDIPPKELRGLADAGKGKLKSGVVGIVDVVDGKAAVVAGVTDDLTDRINAVDLVRAAAAALGGKGGGGRPDMAQAGGPDATRAEQALSAMRDKIAEMVTGKAMPAS